ncbi:hypothetical protein [Reinekea forsetii]|nr:hypothetical protein [Reinekea forsetii]
MKKFDIFGIGAALVDTEIVVTDDFLADMSNQVVKNILSCRAVMVL